MSRMLLMIAFSAGLLACGEQSAVPESMGAAASASGEESNGRWYSEAQATMGRGVFAENCAVCHGAEAQGAEGDWREKLDDGSFRPPPLDGSAHAWHHPLEILLRVIDYGGVAMGGKMPEFIDVLEQDEKLAAIAYFQSFWSDEIYQQWMQMGGSN